MIEGKWLAPGQALSSALSIREAALGIGSDALDKESWNALIFSDSIPVATGRIRYFEGEFVLEHLCVLPAYRHQGYGDVLTRLLLFKAQQHGARHIRLFCPEETKGYFLKFGFKQETEGSLYLSGSDICLDNCKGCGKCRK